MDNVALTSARRRIELEQKHFPQGVTPETMKLMDDVQELLCKAYKAGREAGSQESQDWSNQSAYGYAIAAAERIRMSGSDIQRLVRSMNNRFDMLTLDEAAEHYRKSPY